MEDLGDIVSFVLKSCNLRCTRTSLELNIHVNYSVKCFNYKKFLGHFTTDIVTLLSSDIFLRPAYKAKRYIFFTYKKGDLRSASEFDILHYPRSVKRKSGKNKAKASVVYWLKNFIILIIFTEFVRK